MVEYRPAILSLGKASSTRLWLDELLMTSALVLGLITLWTLTHRYQGIGFDAQLYAFQALAKLHPVLDSDLYLQNPAQDRYTIFSPLYAALIGWLGLQQAGLMMMLACAVGFFTAAWMVVRQLAGSDAAYFAVALLIVTGGIYGAAHVFHFSEDFVTARSLAEALVAFAVACHFRDHKRTALLVAGCALFVHPLIALPGLLLLLCLRVPLRLSIAGALAGIAASITIAIAPSIIPPAKTVITIMDPEWLYIVRERAQFLFLQLWTTQDWELNARPFVSLMFTVLVIRDERVRQLALAAILVGASGLAVAFIAGTIGPAAILLQGQAWRWVWITGFVSVMLLAPTVMYAWHDEKCGPLCVVLVILAWTFEATDVLLCTVCPLILWIARSYINPRMARLVKWAAVAIGIGVMVWALSTSWMIVRHPVGNSGREPLFLQKIKYIFDLKILALALFWILWSRMRNGATLQSSSLISAVLAVFLVLILPASFKQVMRVGSAAEIEEFADWEARIPADSTVFVTPAQDSGAFVWFTLGRPNYLSLSQSAGVVFSRATAMEVKRRSDVLLPVTDPDWKILTNLFGRPKDPTMKPSSSVRPLTRARLLSICLDPLLGFVVSNENVGFDPVRHMHPGTWKDWNLYDCTQIRAGASAS